MASYDHSRIMVVDDSEMLRELIGNYLGVKGYDITTARDGVDALEKWEAGPFPLIVTDLDMPKMSGPELLATMCKSRRSFKAVVMSAYLDEGIKTDLRDKGAFAFLQKPFSLGELEAVIRQGLTG